MTIQQDFERGGEPVRVRCESEGGERFTVRIGDVAHDVLAHRTPDGRVSFSVDGRAAVAAVAPAGRRGGLHVRLDGRTWRIERHVGARAGAAAGGTGVLEAPMTGTVLAVHVEVGDTVESDETVAVVTAMKMEHKIVAGLCGTVSEVGAAAGDTVEQGHLLVRIDPDPRAPG